MTKEQKFYKALQDVFIGARIEGEGGFVNLMKIKSNYYRNIETLLKQDIEEALKKYPAFRDEHFDKLYSNIDIAETLSNLTGKWIKQVKSEKLKVKGVIFEDGTEIDIENLDYKLIKPLIWWD